jgi:hypothetical protein
MLIQFRPSLACPRCGGSEDIYRSRWRYWDLLALIFLLRPLRCLACNKRYYAPLFYGKRISTKKGDSGIKSRAANAGGNG